MKLTVGTGPLTEATGDVLVVERYAGETRLGPDAARVDRALGGMLGRVLAEERFEGRGGETVHVHAAGGARGEGALLGLYAFDRYKAKKNGDRAVETLTVMAPGSREQAPVREGLRVAELTAEATNFARDLINEPANAITATAR